MAEAGEFEDGITQMREGVAATRALGPTFLTYLLGSLAEGHAKAGRVEQALDVVAEALAVAEKTGERFYEAELLGLRGRLLLVARHDGTGAEQCFRTALHTAQRQGARTLERRAITSLRQLREPQERG